MVQTLSNRIKKGKIDVNDYDNIIVDECHRGEFFKIINNYNGKLIGFTATPYLSKSESYVECSNCNKIHPLNTPKCCNIKPVKYRKTISLKTYYNKLIQGVDIDFLIKEGYLVPDINYTMAQDNLNKLELDSFGEYSDRSQSLVFGSKMAMDNFCEVFKQLAEGKKTIVFNANTLINKNLYQRFADLGYPVKMYDSKNKGDKREDIVKWFRETPSAILFNVHVFTTGFDVREVECIILNKATASLNLFIQMVGRGGRTTTEIVKQSFDVIDMGGNITEHGKWSNPRDWNELFSKEVVKKVGSSVAPVRQCHQCEAIVSANCLNCTECGAEKKFTGGVCGIPKINGKIPLPNITQIINYCEVNNLGMLEARKMVYNHFAKMFWDTPYKSFLNTKHSGELYSKIWEVSRKIYFAIQKSNLPGNKCRTTRSFINEIIKKIEREYENRRPDTSGDL